MASGPNLVKSAWESGDLVFRGTGDGAEKFRIGRQGINIAELSFGAAEEATIASGVLTVTKSYVRVTSESGTTDTVDSISKADAADGDILILVPKSTDTITYDDANIDLGAATRATAPGGVIVLLYNSGAVSAASWQEVVFLAASDNA